MFGFATSPTFYPTGPNSIDQALASLLEGNQLQPGSTGQSQADLLDQQIKHILSPQHAQQATLGFSSPPYNTQYPSPSAQSANSPYHPASYDPFQANIDPALQQHHQQQQMQSQASQIFSPVHPSISNGTLLLSPQPSHYGSNVTASGRPMSSPRRLQAMKSAPNLGSMYYEQGQGYNPFGTAHSPTPRKASLKRTRNAYGEDSEDEYDEYGEGPGGSDESQVDDDYRPMSGRPLKKRSMSNLSSHAIPQVNTTPNRLRPGPKPKSSLPNLHSHQTVFAVEINAPPVPALPRAFSQSATSDDADGLQVPQAGISKDQLAEYYHVGISNKQTKKGRPQRMYICGIQGCGKEFPRKSAVESHIQTHLEDKPFACPYDDW